MSSDDSKPTPERKKKAEQVLETTQDQDLLSLNESNEEVTTPEPNVPKDITDYGALKQQGEDEFDPGDYGGFPTESWQRYFGSVNDKRQSRSAALSVYGTFKVRYNPNPDEEYPDFNQILELKYYPVSKKMWEKRRRDLAEIEDLEREAQIQATKLAETQEALRLRIFNRNKPRGIVTNRDDPNKATLEEIQNNMKFFEKFEAGIGLKVSEGRQKSDLEAFKMYFHKGKEVYEQIMNEDIDDILRACDWKQIYGSANLRLSKPSVSQVQPQGIS